MILKNASVLTEDFKFKKTHVQISGSKISAIGEDIPDTEIMDCSGLYIIPGLVDIHTHGAVGTDTMDKDFDFDRWNNYLLKIGVTTFFPTTVSESDENICSVLSVLAKNDKIEGINLEGPYINANKCGAHNEKVIRKGNFEEMAKYINLSGNKIKITTIAPEIEGNLNFIKKLKSSFDITISIGHSESDYDTANLAFEAGTTNLTHTFNAMNPFTHRDPSLIGAALINKDITCEVIADGIHLHPSVVLMLYKILGADRMVLISDSMAATGLEDGNYTLGNTKVIVKDSVARTLDGAIAGSTKNLMQMVKSAINFGISAEDAIKMATLTPARVANTDKQIGSIAEGKNADLVVCDKDLNVIKTFKNGSLI